MRASEAVLFTAAHGFYQFAISADTFDRSLYYNLLLQPALAIPDHYFLQGSRVAAHLKSYPSRDSWIESALRNGFIVPHFRDSDSSLSELLARMEDSDRRGFGPDAARIAERLDRTSFTAEAWSSSDNSRSFGEAFSRYLTSKEAPILELQVDPDDFVGFWERSREWISHELNTARERSGDLLGTDGLLLSQLIQVSGERLLGPECGRITSIDALLDLTRQQLGESAVRDLHAYYTCACELYNRSLADTILTSPGSPRWSYFVAAMDLWRDDVLESSGIIEARQESIGEQLDVPIRLPRVSHLRSISGDTLSAIRRTPAAERYFESLADWRRSPNRETLRGELVESLQRYSVEIRKQVGRDVGTLGLRPQFISGATDVTRVVEKLSGVVQGFLSVGSVPAAAAAAMGHLSPLVPAVGFATLFVLQTAAKYHSPHATVDLQLSSHRGLRVYPDVTITRA